MIESLSSKSIQDKQIYAFIDSQNLNLGTIKYGWKIDWRRFRNFLTKRYNVTKAYMFIGYIAENEPMYEQLHDAGFLIALKPVVDYQSEDEHDEHAKNVIKGNIDADLVLFTMKLINEYDQAILVSGDGDFAGLVEYLLEQHKLLKILVPNWRYSTLLKPYEKYIDRIDSSKRLLAYKSNPKRS